MSAKRFRGAPFIAVGVSMAVVLAGVGASNGKTIDASNQVSMDSLNSLQDQGGVKPGADGQVMGKTVSSVDGWNPKPAKLAGLPKDLFVVNDVPVIPPAPPESMTRTELAQAQDAWKTQGPALGVDVKQVDPGRVNGIANVLVSVPRTMNPGVGVKGLQVQLQAPAGTKIVKAGADGWYCNKKNVCSYASVLGSTDVPTSIPVRLAVTSKAAPGQVKVQAIARWNEQQLRNGIGGSTGLAGSFEVVGWGGTGSSNNGDLTIDPPLSLSVAPKPVNRVTILTNGEAKERQALIQAKLGNTAGRPVAVTWKQIAGPAVTMLYPAAQQTSGDNAGQTIEFPSTLTSTAKVTFQVSAESEGVTLRKTVTVIANPAQMTTQNPRTKSLRKLFKHTAGKGHAKYRTYRDDTAAAAQAKRSARAAQIPTAPVVIAKKPTNVPGVRPASQGGARSPFCQIADKIAKLAQATVTLPDGSRLVVPADSTYTGDCASGTGQISFSAGSLVIGNLAFSDVVGIMTVQGFTLTSAKLATPAQMKGAPYVGSLTLLPVEPLTGSPVGAAMTDGVWSNLSGSFFLKPFSVGDSTVNGFNFQKLPNGWSIPAQAAQLAFAGPGQVTFVQTATNTEGSSLQYSIANLAASDSTLSVQVTAGNFKIRLKGTDNLTLAGSGSITVRPGLAVSGGVSLSTSCASTCELIDNLQISNATLTINPSTAISMRASLRAAMVQDHNFDWSAAGTYGSSGVYSLNVNGTNTSVVNIGGVGQLSNDISGSIVSKPATSGGTDFAVSVSGTVKGLSGGTTLTNLKTTGLFSNTCPETAVNCSPAKLLFFVNIVADFAFPTAAAEHVDAVTQWDMADGTFSKEVALHDSTIGPEMMGITASTLVFSTTPSEAEQSCQPTAQNGTVLPAKPTVPGQIYVSLTGEGTFDSRSYEYGAVMMPGGYCFHGSIGDYEVTDGQTINGGSLVFSTADALFTPPGGDDTTTTEVESYQPVRLTKNTLYVIGSFTLPSSVTDLIGGSAMSGKVLAWASISQDKVLRLQVDYTLANPVYIVGNSNTQSLRFDGISLFVIVSKANPKAPTIGFSVRGSYYIPGGSNPVTEPASVTPLVGTISVNLGTTTSLTLQLGVDTSSGPVRNAFGTKDLTIYNLALAGTIGLVRSVSFLGDASLPSDWTSKLMLVNEPRVQIGFNINFSDPAASCVVFTIGQAGQTEDAFDLGGFGVVTAKYLNVVLAPKGCALPTGQGFINISPGVAMTFDGAIFGVAVKVHFALTMDPATNAFKSIDAQLQVQALRFGDLYVGGVLPESGPMPDPLPPVNISLWYSTGSPFGIKAAIDGSVLLGDPDGWGSARVNVKGQFEMSSILPGPAEAKSPKKFALQFAGTANVKLLGMNLTNFELLAKVNGILGTPGIPVLIQSATVKAKFGMSVFGTPLRLQGTVALVFNNGDFERVYLSLTLRMSLLIASFSGTVILSYCRGEMVPNTHLYDEPIFDPDTFVETTPCKSGLRYGPNEGLDKPEGTCRANAGIHFGVYLRGELEFLFWSTSTTIPVYTSESSADGCTDPTPLQPGMPAAPSAVAGDSQVTVSGNGTMPDVGGGDITSYVMSAWEAVDGGTDGERVPAGTCTYSVDTATSCDVTGLQNGTVYFFTATAKNSNGEAGPSVESDLVTPAAPPGSTAPQAPTVSAGTGTVTVTPVAPEVAPSSAIVSYDVRAMDASGTAVTGAVCEVVLANDSSCTVGTGSSAGKLTNGTPYTFQTQATLADDSTMDWSPSSTPVAPKSPVVVPNIPTVTVGNHTVNVTPSSTSTPSGGYLVNAFTEDPDNAGQWTIPAGSCQISDPTTDTDCSIAGLPNGTPVKISVRAIYPGEMSQASGLTDEITPVLPLGVPGQPAVVSGDSAAQVTFDPATSGSPTTYTATAYSQDPNDLTAWTVSAGSCSVSATSDPLRCTITGLDNTKFYKVFAKTNASTDASDASDTFHPQPAPAAMSAPLVQAMDRRLAVTAVPNSAGGQPGYYLLDALDSSGAVAASCTVHDGMQTPPGCTIYGLQNGIGYRVRATAVNGAGTAQSDLSGAVAPGAMPSVPQAPTVKIGDGTATLTFRPGSTGGSPSTYTGTAYNTNGTQAGSCVAAAGTTPITCTITGLSNDQPYRFTATAANSVGTSSASTGGDTIRLGRPQAVAPTVAMRAGTPPSATVTARAASAGGTPTQTSITAYTVGSSTPIGQCTVTGAAGTCTINGLKSGTKYEFRAVASNDAGASLASNAAGPYTA